MNDQNPLQNLDAAVRDFINSLDPDAVPSGWVLAYQTSYLQADDPNLDPLVWDTSYAIAPGLSPFAAIGLARHTASAVSTLYREVHEEDEEDDQ